MLNNLGKFKIVSEVGHGAMGVVYRAEDNLGRSVALKVLPPRLAGDPELVQRFNREARSAAGLKHPNIVVIYESSQIDDTSYIAMEFIEGEGLDQIISSRKAVPIIKRLDIIIQTCRGLQYAHKRQIVHRDIKPSNIMVEHDGSVKIVDFGIAHLGGGTMLTVGGQILGTPSYMSPEQTKGRGVDARSDIFSIGVVLFELLTYQKPFRGDDVGAVWYNIQNEQPPPLSELLPACPPELQKVVSKALAKNREDRYQTAEDLGFALQQVSDYFKHDMIQVYVQEGRRHLEEGNLTVAKESIQRALEIDSSHDVARSLFDQVQEQIEARRRAQRVEQVLRQAKEALQAAQFDQAIALLDEVLQLDPGREDARQYRTLAVERRDRVRKISQHLERAEKLAADADLQGAKKELEALLALDRTHSAAQRMLDWVLKELAEQERQRQVREWSQDARNHLAQQNFDQARDLLEKALALDPINIEVEGLLRQVRSSQEKEKQRQRREGLLAGIQGALKTQDFEQAVALAEQASEEFPGDPQVLKLHAQAVRLAELEKKQRYVEEQLKVARKFFQKDQYAEAINVLQRTLETVPNDVRLTSYLQTVQEAQQQAAVESLRREAIRKAGALIREKKFALAIGALEEALARAGESPEILEVLKFAREQQAEQQKEERTRQVLAWAQICLREQDFEEALRVLAEARRESSSPDLDALEAAAGEQKQQFEQRRAEMIRQARRSLEAGEAAAAVALLESAPKACFKNEEFRQLLAQCREGLDRATAIRLAAAELEKAEAEGDPERAKKLLQRALQTYPNEPVLLTVQERLRAEELRLRQIEWRKLLDDAKVAVGQMEYERAVGILTSLPPEIAKAPELASEAQALQEEAKRRAHELALRRQAIEAANEQIRENQFAPAIATLEKAAAEAGPSPELTDLLRLARGRQGERIRQVLDGAQALLASDDYQDALNMLGGAQKEVDASEITALLASAQDQQRKFELRRQETLHQARQFLEAGDAGKAIALLDAAPKSYVKNEEYQRLHAQCREGLERAGFIKSTLVQVETSLKSGDLVYAESALQQALRRYPEEPVLRGAKTRLEKEKSRLRRTRWTELLEEARAALNRSDCGRALEVLESLPPDLAAEHDLASEARTLQAQARRMESQFAARRQALREAKEHLSGNNYSRAIETLEKAVAVAGESAELAELIRSARERKAEQHRQDLVRQLLAQVHQLQDEHNYEEATRILEQAQGELNAAEIAAALKIIREQQRQFEEIQRKTQWGKVIDEAKAALGRMAYQRAIELLASLPPEVAAIPELASTAAALLGEARLSEQGLSVTREAVRAAQEQLQAGEHQRAIETLEKAIAEAGQSPELASLLKRAREQAEQVRQERICGILDQACQLQRNGNFDGAVSVLEQAQRELSAREIDSLLSAVKEQRRLAQQQDEILQQARQLLEAGESAKVLALLEAAPKSFLENDELRRIYAACREKLERANFVGSSSARIEALLNSGDVAQARTLLDGALKKYADEPALLGFQECLQQEESRLERARRSRQIETARAALDRGEYKETIEILKTLPSDLSETPELVSAARELREQARRMEQQALQRLQAIGEANQQIRTNQFARAIATLEGTVALAGPSAETDELLRSAQDGLRRARERHREQLLAIEQRLSKTRRSKLEGLVQQVQQIATGYSAEDELAMTAARLRQRIEAEIAAPVAPRKPLPWKRVAVSVAVAAALVAAIALGHRLFQTHTIPVEILSDPPGASVRIGDKSCIAPNCKFELLPGQYQVQAELGGYQTLRQILKVDSQLRTHPVGLALQPLTVAQLGDRNQPAKVEQGTPETPRGQQVEAGTGEPRSPTPKPPLQPAKSVAGPVGKPPLPVANGPTPQQTTQEAPPSQTMVMNRPSVSPPESPKPPEPASPEAIEETAWEETRGTSEPGKLEDFLKKHGSGPHAPEAEARLEKLEWDGTKKEDLVALKAYVNRFPKSTYSGEASRKIEDLGRTQAQQKQREADEQAIKRVLDQFNSAFKAGQPRDVKQVWPTVPGRYTAAMRVPGSTFVMTLHPVGEAVVNGDAASIPCQLDTRTKVSGSRPSETQKTGTVTLRKDGDHWTIVDVMGAG
jgi:serine/threonine-protein kinase